MWWTENRAKEKIENNVKTLLIKQRKLSGLPDLPQWFKNKIKYERDRSNPPKSI